MFPIVFADAGLPLKLCVTRPTIWWNIQHTLQWYNFWTLRTLVAVKMKYDRFKMYTMFVICICLAFLAFLGHNWTAGIRDTLPVNFTATAHGTWDLETIYKNCSIPQVCVIFNRRSTKSASQTGTLEKSWWRAIRMADILTRIYGRSWRWTDISVNKYVSLEKTRLTSRFLQFLVADSSYASWYLDTQI